MPDPAPSQSSGPAAPRQCADFGVAAHRTVELAFEFVGGTARDIPQLLTRPSVMNAIQRALQEEAQKIMREQSASGGGEQINGVEAARRLGEAVVGSSRVRDQVLSQAQQSPEYQRLRRSIRELGCAFDNSPVGVFVDNNSTWLIIVGAVGAIGGAAAMYYFEAGDTPAQAFSFASNQELLKVGSISVSTGEIEFVPSERRVRAGIAANAEFSNVQASLRLQAGFTRDELTSAGGSARIVTDLRRTTRVTAEASASFTRAQPGEGGTPNPDRIEGRVAIGARETLSPRATLNVRVYGEYAQTDEMQRVRGGAAADLRYRPSGAGAPTLRTGVDVFGGSRAARTPGTSSFGAQQADVGVQFTLGIDF
ncbi:MAG: hypothetical protein AAFR38_14865 [Planctomycetota bacterium]